MKQRKPLNRLNQDYAYATSKKKKKEEVKSKIFVKISLNTLKLNGNAKMDERIV